MKRDSFVDLYQIPEQQLSMHDRLENWARSCFGGYGTSTSPMFRQYRSPEHWHAPMATVPVDHQDASRIAKGVAMLPDPHMRALDWFYVRRSSVMSIRQAIGCTSASLHRYVVDARTMLINRRV